MKLKQFNEIMDSVEDEALRVAAYNRIPFICFLGMPDSILEEFENLFKETDIDVWMNLPCETSSGIKGINRRLTALAIFRENIVTYKTYKEL